MLNPKTVRMKEFISDGRAFGKFRAVTSCLLDDSSALFDFDSVSGLMTYVSAVGFVVFWGWGASLKDAL